MNEKAEWSDIPADEAGENVSNGRASRIFDGIRTAVWEKWIEFTLKMKLFIVNTI